jgi:hypothetical protein
MPFAVLRLWRPSSRSLKWLLENIIWGVRIMVRMLFASASALVLSTSVAWAECAPDNWQDCAGKPWVEGDKMETPIGSIWWPNEQWGEGDEAGSTNWYTQPEVVLRALAEADQGKVYKLGHEYNSEMPLFGTRQFIMRIPGTPDRGAVRRQQDRLARRVHLDRDRPGWHAVRRPRPYRRADRP